MPIARRAVALAVVLLAAPAAAEELAGPPPEPARRPYVTLDLSLGLGSGNSTAKSEMQFGYGLQLTARPGPLVLAGSLEGATNFFESGHGFFTGGLGAWRQLESGRIVLVGLYGVHAVGAIRLAGNPEEHHLPVLGARAAWELDAGRWILGRASFVATGYADLKREYDADLRADVGGVTVLLSLALGLGF